MVEEGDTVSATLRKEFGEEALNSIEASPEQVLALMSVWAGGGGRASHRLRCLPRPSRSHLPIELPSNEIKKDNVHRLAHCDPLHAPPAPPSPCLVSTCKPRSPGRAQQAKLRAQLDVLFKRGTPIFRGYCDDPRNTDHAWMETVCVCVCACVCVRDKRSTAAVGALEDNRHVLSLELGLSHPS